MVSLKFSIGSLMTGYKTVEFAFSENEVRYRIVRSGLLDLKVNLSGSRALPASWLATWKTFRFEEGDWETAAPYLFPARWVFHL